MSSYVHVDNKKRHFNSCKKSNTSLEHKSIVEKMKSINFTKKIKKSFFHKKKFCLTLQYNGRNSYLFVNGTEIYKFNTKDSEIVATSLCLGNISKDWSEIHKYLMKKMT